MNENYDQPGNAAASEPEEQCFAPGCLFPDGGCYGKELGANPITSNTGPNLLAVARAIDAAGGACPGGCQFSPEQIEEARKAVEGSGLNEDDISWP